MTCLKGISDLWSHTFRRRIFHNLHGLSHPSTKASTKLIVNRYVWHNMNRDVIHHQRSTMHRHTKNLLGHFLAVGSRSQQVHVDLVCPLSPSRDCTYSLACVDCFTKWPVAGSLPNVTSETAARAPGSCIWVPSRSSHPL